MHIPLWAGRPVHKWPAPSLVVVLALVPMAAGSLRAFAHEGHDHGEKPAEGGAAPISPRIVAVSEAYLFVGLIEGEVLVVYLDRAADNAPVTGAVIEVSLGGVGFNAVPQPKGTYEVTAPLLRKPGTVEVVVTVTEGTVSDLLVGSVVIPSDAVAASGSPGPAVWLPMAWLKGVFGGARGPGVVQTAGLITASGR